MAPRAAAAGVSNLRAGFLCKEENSLLELMVIVVVKNFGGTADPIIQVEAENQGKVARFIQVYLSPYVLEVIDNFYARDWGINAMQVINLVANHTVRPFLF